MKINLFKSRVFRFGVVSTVITIAVVTFIVLLNLVVSALFKKYPLNIDLTEDKIFQISNDTKEFLAALDTDVTIYVLNTEDRFIANSPEEYYVQANEVINKYAQLSGRIRLTYLDLMRNPDFASRYPDQDIQVNDILVSSGNKSRVLKGTDLFNIRSSYYGSYISSSKAEQAMTSALLAVTSRNFSRAVFLEGHGEDNITTFAELLKLNAWEVGTQNLLTEDIDESAQLLILCAPTRDFGVDELRKLDRFLEGGNHRLLFYLASSNQPDLPNVASFLAEWGIAVEPGVAFESDPNRMLGNNPYIALLDYAEEEYSQAQARQGLFAVLPQSRPLKALFEAARYRRVKTLLKYSSSSGIRPANAEDDWTPNLNRLEGDIPALMLSSQMRNNVSGDLEYANVLVSGSALALNQSLMGSPNLANSAYFLDLLARLAGREDRIFIMDKSVGMEELGVSTGQGFLFGIIFTVLLPLGVIIAGVVVWLRRRHK